MDIRKYGEQFRSYWREQSRAFLQDFRRLDVVSRPTAAGVLVLGAVTGLIPLSALIVVFRLVDAVTGARAVRVMTSDLHKSLLTLCAAWLIAVVAWVLMHWLQGLTRKLAERTAAMVFMASVTIVVLLIAPFRTMLITANHAVLHPWMYNKKLRIACVIVHLALALSTLLTVNTYLLSRSISVGSYLLFLGAILGSLTMTIWHAARHSDV